MAQNIKITLLRFFKILWWIIFSVILLMLCLGLVVQLPAVQRVILKKTTGYLQHRTHAQIAIKKIALSFPTAVILEGVAVKDLSDDTLLSVSELKVNLAMLALFKKKISIERFFLSDGYVRLHRSANDSTFNFNFLITAFSDTTQKKAKDTVSSGSPDLSVHKIILKNVRFVYDDQYSGLYTSNSFSSLDLDINKLDLKRQLYLIRSCSLKGLRGTLELTSNKSQSHSEKKSTLPIITVEKINLTDCAFAFADNTVKQSVISLINELTLNHSAIDLNSENIKAGNLFLGQSVIRVNMTQRAKEHPENIPHEIKRGIEHGWKVSANNIYLKNNSFGYNIVNVKQKQNEFDPGHINYKDITLKADRLFYSAQKMYVTVESFSALNPGSLQVREFSTHFFMNNNTISATTTHLKTDHSEFNGNTAIFYSRLENIGDSVANLAVVARVRRTSVYPRDVSYFAPRLNHLPFFSGSQQVHITGEITGTIGNLDVKKLTVNTGNSTRLETNFAIQGLPDVKHSYLDLNKFILKSGREDIQSLIGTGSMPKNIHLPETLGLSGTFKGYYNEFSAAFDLNSSFGDVSINCEIDKSENFEGFIRTENFDAGNLLNNKKLFGEVTLTARINGHGLDTQTVKANIDLAAPKFYLNQYTYHNLQVDGTFSKKTMAGKIMLNDSNIVLNTNGFVNLNKGAEQYKFTANLEGADLKKLHLTDKDLKIGCLAVCDLTGSDVNTFNGTAGITQIVVVSKGKKYILDSLIFAAINKEGNNQMTLQSAIVGIKYKGSFAPGNLLKELKQNINSYFSIQNRDSTLTEAENPQQFSFEIILHNHPVISEVFLPDLKEFEPGKIQGSYSTEKKQLLLNFSIERLLYKNYDVNSLVFEASSDEKKLNYKLSSGMVSNSRLKFDNLLIEGKIEDAAITTHIASTDEKGDKKLKLSTILKPFNKDYKLFIDPKDLFIMNEQWNVSPDNYFVFGKDGFWFHNLLLTKQQHEVFLNTIPETVNGETKASLKNFALDDFSRLIEKDTGLVKGTVNGSVNFRKINQSFGFDGNLSISDLNLRNIAVGNVRLTANNKTQDVYDIDLSLSGAGNNVSAKGTYDQKQKEQALDLDLVLKPLTAPTLEAFSFGKIRDASGAISGSFKVRGNPTAPDLTGSLLFENVTLTPAILNSSLYLKSETIAVKPQGFTFNSFTMLDKNQNPAVINGNVTMNHFSDFKFGLNVNTTNFLLLNTSAKDNEHYFGTMIIDSKIRVHGTPDYPVINSSIKLKNGSNFTFAVTEDKLTTDRGENIIMFVDSMKFNPILTRNEKIDKSKSELKNFDISSSIEIDKKAGIRLLLDPITNDSLVVRGEAALSFAIDPSGKTSLTGVYNLSEGSYVVSLENLVRKKFNILPGSTITWNGDPLDAIINITAGYYIRTSPIDLVAGQVTGAELGSYRQRYPFVILLKLRGALLTPDIAFEIQLQQSDKGAAGGTINAKLEQLNDMPSSLNKQVFALLVLNRFIQENPLQTETNAGENAARTTVGKMLTAQLNQLSSKLVPGVDINFDVQSYDDYSSGKVQGRTQVGMGVSKQLFDERLSVQVGSSVDVEGEKAKQNTATNVTGDVIVEYKVTKDGRYRLKGFRNNQYQGALEGQVIQTGAGIIYVRDFNEWLQLFTKEKKTGSTNTYYDVNAADGIK